MERLQMLLRQTEPEVIALARELVRIRSYSGREEAAIRHVERTMQRLGYDEVVIDGMGNVLGRIGSGAQSIMFDSHVDTVEVEDEDEWAFPPFGGEIVDGRLHGRGSVDMKSAAAASIYAAVLARRLNWDEGKTIYVSCSVMEEDCDGENLKHLFRGQGIRPDRVVICEPSDNLITLGHKGKAQMIVRTRGVSAHGAAPQRGKNAVYEMAEIIQRVEALNAGLSQQQARGGSLTLSRISSLSASLNAVPFECEIYLDRRMVPGETEETVRREMDELTCGKNAAWQVGTLERTSWTGMRVVYEPLHPPWQIEDDHPLTRACNRAYKKFFGHQPQRYDYWDFSTNAVAAVAAGIPTIGFGPGAYELAHMRDESCPIGQITDACGFYAALIHETA